MHTCLNKMHPTKQEPWKLSSFTYNLTSPLKTMAKATCLIQPSYIAYCWKWAAWRFGPEGNFSRDENTFKLPLQQPLDVTYKTP